MRRLFWMGVGAVAGVSGTVWAERKVRATARRAAARRTGRHRGPQGQGGRPVGRRCSGRRSRRHARARAELRDHYGRGDAADRRHRAGGATRPMTSTWPSTPPGRHRT